MTGQYRLDAGLAKLGYLSASFGQQPRRVKRQAKQPCMIGDYKRYRQRPLTKKASFTSEAVQSYFDCENAHSAANLTAGTPASTGPKSLSPSHPATGAATPSPSRW